MKNLIREELEGLLKETDMAGNNKFTFTHTLQDFNQLSFHNYHAFSNEYDTDITSAWVTVTWSLIVNRREWGVKGFDIDVSNVQGIFQLNLLDRHTDEVVQEVEKNINEFEWRFVSDTSAVQFDSSLYINELDFDFNAKTCTVIF